MSKLEWHHLIHVAHFTGFFLLLALPVSSVLIWIYGPNKNEDVNLKFAELLSRLDRTAQVGLGILILSGIGQIWGHSIGPGEIFGDQVWLGIKLALVTVLVVAGALVSGPVIRARKALLAQITAQQGEMTPSQELALRQSYLITQRTGMFMLLLILAILFMVIFHPFTAAYK